MADNRIKRLSISNFSVFTKAEFEFTPGINVFIGENGTGKTHLLKLLYSMLKPFDASQSLPNEHPAETKTRFNNKLLAVFRPDDRQPGRLVSDLAGKSGAKVRLNYNRHLFVEFSITPDGKLRPLQRSMQATPNSLFIPPREALAMYEGFVAAYENRELSFDETYYDLCKALAASRLRGEAKEGVRGLLVELEKLMGGRLSKKGSRFYLEKEGRRDLEAHLLAEGLRKIAMLYRLVANGSVAAGTILFLDEPEASLNPKLVTPIVLLLRTLAARGVQIFIGTHDFLLTQELSLAAEYHTEPGIPIRFFALTRDLEAGVAVETGPTLSDLSGNPILDEFAAYYDREQQLFMEPQAEIAKGLKGAKETH